MLNVAASMSAWVIVYSAVHTIAPPRASVAGVAGVHVAGPIPGRSIAMSRPWTGRSPVFVNVKLNVTNWPGPV